jgi:HD-GYP domain-containing protein (c-di-GMP phosphodiesterase class II)
MWKKPGAHLPLDPSQLRVGVYVWLDMPWLAHPFIANRFLVQTQKDIAVLQALASTGHLYYYPEKSTAQPGPLVNKTTPSAPDAQALAEKEALQLELQRLEQQKKERLQRQKALAEKADQAWNKAASSVRGALVGLTHSPKSAGKQLTQLSNETAATVTAGQDVLLHLLGDKTEQGPHFHALNTMTLCVLVGQRAGLAEGELSDLALAALAHDTGKSEIPQHILKNAKRKKHEEDFYRQHVHFSVQFAAKTGVFSRRALDIIADHHELLDGSGWPAGKKDADIGARILSVVDRYDRLCSPEAPDRERLMPAEALATMFSRESDKFDLALLSILIKLLGIYPPGTVVQLSDGALALVISPGQKSLQPRVLIYNPDIPKDDAPTLELDTIPGLKITEAIRHTTLPQDVLEWLNPQQRLSYYFSASDTAN